MDSIQQMQEWIQDCRDNHLECNVGTTSELPSRLLKLSWLEARGPSIKLEQPEPSKEYRYVALSHCWNFTNPLRTTKENQAEYLISIPWDELSKALQDSVMIALALNYTYMWIDSLCIIQNDAADWKKEAPRMGMIYNNANVVFAAHGAELFVQKRKPESILDLHRLESPPIFCRQKMDHKAFFITPEDTHSWFGRAWCMQERIFAKRILHFGGPYEKDKEVVFECNTYVKCECSRIIEELEPIGVHKHTLKANAAIIVPNEDINSITARNLAWRSYISSCEDYTARGLTYASDTLSALSSLMKTFAPYLGKYYAGIWQHNLLLSLQWEALDTGASSRGEKYVAPTFSWASRSGAVIWYLGSAEDLTSESRIFPAILDADCTLAGEDPFGQVSGGYIKLRGYITEMRIESKGMCSPDGRLEMTKEGTESCYVTLDSIQDVENLQVGASVVCLDIMRDRAEGKRYVSGLVILPVASQNGCYRRIGFSTMLEEHFKDSSTQEVIIV